jgi:5-methylcytosine-specific restriction endonuclease McrA
MGKIKLKCMQCGKEFETQSCYFKRGGNANKFCSRSCSTTYMNLTNNPSWRPEVREKISKNHADVSGKNNYWYGVKGKDNPNYIDGLVAPPHRKIYIRAGKELKCKLCGSISDIEIHHKDGDHFNNDLENLVALCRTCHHTKAHLTLRDEKGRIKAVILNDINWEVV